MTPRALHILRVCWGIHYKLDINRTTCIRSQTPYIVSSNWPASLLTHSPRIRLDHLWVTVGWNYLHMYILMGFPGDSVGNILSSNVGTMDLIPRSGRYPGGGHGNPLQYSCLENSMDRGDIVLQTGVLQSVGSKRVGHDWSDLAHTHVHHKSTRVFPMEAPQTRWTFIHISKQFRRNKIDFLSIRLVFIYKYQATATHIILDMKQQMFILGTV